MNNKESRSSERMVRVAFPHLDAVDQMLMESETSMLV